MESFKQKNSEYIVWFLSHTIVGCLRLVSVLASGDADGIIWMNDDGVR